MNVFSNKLDQLEARLQNLIEGRLARLLPGREQRDRLIQSLARAMEVGSRLRPDGITLAPDVFVLLVHPSVASGIEANTYFLEGLSQNILQIGAESGLMFAKPPDISVSPNAEIALDGVDVVARISQGDLGETVESTSQVDTNKNNIPENTFLIVNGVRLFQLTMPVVNIGRRAGNDLVIEDQRVSRSHAQLRASRGIYVLFDLDSTGGTFVNGQRVAQRKLVPQDVISLAGVPLVYGQDAGSGPGLGQTQKMSSQSSTNGLIEGTQEDDHQ